MTRYIVPAPHEFAANFLFNEHGLTPFFATDRSVKQGGGSQRTTFTDRGERWTVTLYYQSSNIVHPGTRLPTGTEWRLEEMREFRLKVTRNGEEDPVGEQSFNAHITPRWSGMKAKTKDGDTRSISVPEGFREGINVRLQGSNIKFARYHDLLQRAMATVGIRSEYFENLHKFSNVQDAERYVRIHRDKGGPVHARDGPIASMGHLLENDRQGYRKVVQNDEDGHGRTLPGYYHTVTLGPRRVREAFPTHALPKEVKHYYAREAASQPDDSALAHPKVGVSYQVNRWKEKLGASSESLERLERELDQTLLSVLAEAGIDVAPEHGSGAFVEDAYFQLDQSDCCPEPVSLELSKIRSTQESIVVKHLADGLSPVQWESLETLISDGKDISPSDIASEHGRHPESVRRALRGMEDLVEREYAKVSLRSKYVAELVHDAVSEAQDAVQRATDASAKALNALDRGYDQHMSAFVAWAAKHGVDVDDALSYEAGRMELRFGNPGREARRAVREGFRRWKAAGLPAERFRTAQIRFQDGSLADAWRYLSPG